MNFLRIFKRSNWKDRRKVFIKEFDKLLKTYGFRKKGLNWRKKINDFWILFNLQGSQWGRYFYLNIGIISNKEVGKNFPAASSWHYRERFETVFSLSNKEEQKLFGFDYNHRIIIKNIKSINEGIKIILDEFEEISNYSKAIEWINKSYQYKAKRYKLTIK